MQPLQRSIIIGHSLESLQDEDIVSEESLKEVCEKVELSQELTDKLIGQIGTAEVKEELKRTTQEALDLGVSRAILEPAIVKE